MKVLQIFRLKKLALHCNYETQLKIALRDQLVSGLRDQDTTGVLFKAEKMDYDTTLKEATGRESAEKNASNSLTALEEKSSKSDVFLIRKLNKSTKWPKNRDVPWKRYGIQQKQNPHKSQTC